jgi:hypothetical protein
MDRYTWEDIREICGNQYAWDKQIFLLLLNKIEDLEQHIKELESNTEESPIQNMYK